MSRRPAAPAPAPLDVLGCPLEDIRLIEASAGTGKTWNICGLYLRLLLERGLEVQQILVVTFTNAATAELRERVRTRIVETLDALRGRPAVPGDDDFPRRLVASLLKKGFEKDDLEKKLRVALGCFDEAAIYTIHGFCQRALADTPLAAGLPYAMELLEDDADLRHEVAADYWRREVAGAPAEPLLPAYLATTGDSPESWAALLKRIQAKPLAKRIWPLGLDALGRVPADALRAAFESARALWAARRGAAIDALLGAIPSALKAYKYKPEMVMESASQWDAWLASGDPFLAGIDAKDSRINRFRTGLIEAEKKTGKTAPHHPFFDSAETLLALREDALGLLELHRLRLLRGLAENALPELRLRKRARRVLAYDDILYNAYEALTDGARPWLAATLRGRYPAALIDEFQDTDPLQCAIFFAIYGNASADGGRGPLFLVGDPKQAIYSFRNADLHAYLQAKRRAAAEHTLLRNQRSVAGLLVASNALFGANQKAFVLPGIAYHEARKGEREHAALVDRSDPAAEAPLRIWRIPKDADGNYLLRRELQRLAATATAAEIARLLRASANGKIRLGGRALRAADIAVLVRTHREGSLVKRALGALGIASVELSHESIFDAQDAEELERLLVAILEPGRQGPLLAALATTLMGLSAPEIDALGADEAALPGWIERFEGYRRSWRERGFGYLFRQWIDGEAVSRRLLAREDGERRLTNLLHLGELLHRASIEHPAPEALLRWLAAQRAEREKTDALQLRLESDRKLVQIVTVHKAKGLEYCVTFCPYLWDGYRRRNAAGDACEYHDDDGVSLISFAQDATDDPLIKARLAAEADAEAARLAYVALTRAVHRCYLIAGCYSGTHGRSINATESSKSLLNWIAAGGGCEHADWLEQGLPPDEIEAAWERIAKQAQPHVRLEDLPLAQGKPVDEAGPAPESLVAAPAPPPVRAGWRISSFTALAHGAEHEAVAPDHDARAVPFESGPPQELPARDILRFPRGPSAGDCLHAMFERADFTDRATWDAAIDRALALHPQRMRASGEDSPHEGQREMLRGLLADVLAAKLPGDIVLAELPRDRRLNEFGFSLGGARLDAASLNAWLARSAWPMPQLAFDDLRGYLKGYIDLVFEHGGRWYLADWKSNHLGYAPSDYARPRLAIAMQAHGYHLQHLLYSVALHRYLGCRIADYAYERHFGGVYYLFVRGVRPQWKDASGEACGAWFQRAPEPVIASLDALFAGEALA